MIGDLDKGVRKQKLLPLSVLRFMHDRADSDLDEVITILLIGAHFFDMRSCKCLKTSSKEESNCTHIFRIKNVYFCQESESYSIKV